MTVALLLVIFPFSMAYAAFSDLVSMTIENRVSVILVAAFLLVALLLGFPIETVAAHLATGFFCLAVTFGLFAAGWIGGGDAKLFAATAVWFGPSADMLSYILTASTYGGMLTLVLILARGRMVPATGIGFVDHLLDRDTGVPYGIALGLSGLTTYTTGTWLDLAIRAAA